MQQPPPLQRAFFDRDTVQVARELLGMRLWRTTRAGLLSGRIVETEAYLAVGDPACHAARGKSRKNAAMFRRPGTSYVYAIHARWCFNVVTEPAGTPCAVLIRAVEPEQGIAVMQRNRSTERLVDLTRGPARLCEAFAIDRRLNGWDLTRGERLWLTPDPAFVPAAHPIKISPRIGISSAQDLPLRFYLADCPYVSGRVRDRRAPPC